MIIICLVFAFPNTYGAADTLKPEAEFKIRAWRAPFESIESLLKSPVKIEMNLRSWKHDNQKIIRSETDIHAIYPYPVEFFVDELLNFENTESIYPRVKESFVEYASNDRFGKHSLFVHMGVEVLGFGADYTYVTDNWMEHAQKGYVQKYRLNRSPDGMLYQLLGSWYIEEIMLKGEPHTYIRNYAIIGIQQGTLPMELAMKAFGLWQLKQIFKNLSASVETRYSKR